MGLELVVFCLASLTVWVTVWYGRKDHAGNASCGLILAFLVIHHGAMWVAAISGFLLLKRLGLNDRLLDSSNGFSLGIIVGVLSFVFWLSEAHKPDKATEEKIGGTIWAIVSGIGNVAIGSFIGDIVGRYIQ